jgi:hypothetical protein
MTTSEGRIHGVVLLYTGDAPLLSTSGREVFHEMAREHMSGCCFMFSVLLVLFWSSAALESGFPFHKVFSSLGFSFP